jgi:NAD(P)-dependent dehydrogenase (short-subunit alcohol dehydrogenase family)
MTGSHIPIRRLDHVAILTRSMERSIEHYADFLGVERPLIRDIDRPGLKLRTAMIRAGKESDAHIQLIEPAVGPGVVELQRDGDGAIFEIAFEVEDIDEAADLLLAGGARLEDIRANAVDGPLTAASGNRFFYLSRDHTQGTRTEIVQPRAAASVIDVALRADVQRDGRTAIVTGGASGIGEAIVRAFVHDGLRVAILDLQGDAARALSVELGGEAFCLPIEVDVTDATAVRAAVQSVIAAFGTVDVAVNCAGVNRFLAPEDVDEATWHRLIAVNLDGPWNLCSAVMPEMIRRRSGRIVNIGSAAGVLGIPKAVPYAAAKHGIVGLTRSLAVDLGPYGITVNCVAPGTTLTPLVESATSETFKAEATHRTPLARLGSPSDIANAVVFLASEKAAWISGVVLPVDGGLTACIRAHHWE